MKKNLIYILTLITIVIALNYIHIHPDPFPTDYWVNEQPFFASALQPLQQDASETKERTPEATKEVAS